MKNRFESYKTGEKVTVEYKIFGGGKLHLQKPEYEMTLPQYLTEYISLSIKWVKTPQDNYDLKMLEMMGGDAIILSGPMDY